jgi:Tfp pilus assembly protein PilP
MTKFRIAAVVLIAALALPLVVRAQAPAQPPAKKDQAPPPAPAKPKPNPNLPAPPANFEYTADKRRDPFISLVNRGVDATTQTGPGVEVARRAEGVPGLLTAEIVVRGIVLTRGAYVAMVAGADKKVYSVRAGDKLADGVVRTVTADAVVILQEVNDPLSLEKQREVRKLLRGGEEVK